MLQTRALFEPSATYDAALQNAAQVCGIQPEFWDMFGTRHVAQPDAQKSILDSFGVDCSTRESLDQFVEHSLWEQWGRLVPRTLVISEHRRAVLISVPADQNSSSLQARFMWEDGRSETVDVPVDSLLVTDEGTMRQRLYVQRELPLPQSAQLGYHRLTLQLGSESADCNLVITPDRAFMPSDLEAGGRKAGLAISLYGLRSARNWGVGDFTDLKSFVDWMADEKIGSFVGLNPLHALANRMPYNTSPYLPICTFFRNPLYLDLELVPDLQSSEYCRNLLQSRAVKGRTAELRASQYVEYEKVWRLKLKTLKAAFRQFLRTDYRKNTERAQQFKAYIKREDGPLERYAIYSALDEVMHKQDRNVWLWVQWPSAYQNPDSAETKRFVATHPRLVLFYMYLQWQVDEQIAAVQAHAQQRGMSIGLYHDLALATDRFGSDLWAHRDFYVAGARVGAPPDGFSPEGQDWAFPPPNAHSHKQDGYKLFAESIRQNASRGGALRIDHVMRFFRLFWIPDAKTAKQGVYVKEAAEDLLRVLALESVRGKFLVVGEDLGTVEPFIREELARFGVLSYRLLYFEKNQAGEFRRPAEYPRQALVSAATHDLPTLAGFWSGSDIEARRKAGLLPNDDDYGRQLEEREKEKQNLLDLLHQLTLLPHYFPRHVSHVLEFTGEMHNAVMGFLALTPSMLMLVNQEDLFKDPDQQNLPGSTEQYPNWRHKMRFTLEELRTNPFAVDCTAMLRGWLQNSGRN